MSSPTVQECYRRLDLTPGASWSEVKSAFRRFARETHPDVRRNGMSRDFENISEAYMTLRDLFRSGEDPKDSFCDESRFSLDLSWLWSPFVRASSWVSRAVDDVSRRRKEKRDEREKIRMEEENRRFCLIEDAISEAESSLEAIIERGKKTGGISERHRLLRRLKSSRPEVRSMAISGLLPSAKSIEVSSALSGCISSYGLDDESIEAFSSVKDPVTSLKFALAAAPHFESMNISTARKYLKWLKSVPGGRKVYPALSYPPSSQAAGLLMSQWPFDVPLPDDSRIISLLDGEEEVLVPTLRQLYRRGCPPSVLGKVEKICDKSMDPAVKAWSRAIVSKASVV